MLEILLPAACLLLVFLFGVLTGGKLMLLAKKKQRYKPKPLNGVYVSKIIVWTAAEDIEAGTLVAIEKGIVSCARGPRVKVVNR